MIYADSEAVAIDLSFPRVKSIKDMRNIIAKEVKKYPSGTWLKGIGWQVASLAECRNHPGRMPRKTDFDDISPRHPIILMDFTLYNITVNSKALEVFGIGRDTPDPADGEMERDARGNPTGLFKGFDFHALIMQTFLSLTCIPADRPSVSGKINT